MSAYGGLFTSLFGAALVAVSNYQYFVQQKSMLKRLYGEEKTVYEQVDDEAHLGGQADDPSAVMKEKMKRRNEFSVSYKSYILVLSLKTCCCCFTKFCGPGSWLKRQIASY